MKIEEHVVSLELAKKLKELGVRQHSYFYWREGYHTEESFDNGRSLGNRGVFEGRYRIEAYPHPRITTADVKWNESDLRRIYQTEYAAFTVAELGEMLPSLTRSGRSMEGLGYYCRHDETNAIEDAYTEADVRAKMLIYLLEDSLMEAPSA